MFHKRGGRKNPDKKKGRHCKSHYTAQTFEHQLNGEVPTSSGKWASVAGAGLDSWIRTFYEGQPSRLASHSARNKEARRNRGKHGGSKQFHA